MMAISESAHSRLLAITESTQSGGEVRPLASRTSNPIDLDSQQNPFFYSGV